MFLHREKFVSRDAQDAALKRYIVVVVGGLIGRRRGSATRRASRPLRLIFFAVPGVRLFATGLSAQGLKVFDHHDDFGSFPPAVLVFPRFLFEPPGQQHLRPLRLVLIEYLATLAE